MLKEFVLGTEVAKAGNFHIANISILLKENGLIEGVDYFKFGGITLIARFSLRFPKYINDILRTGTFTDLSELLPLNYFTDLLDNQTKAIKDKFDEVNVDGKKFVKINDKRLFNIINNETIIKSVVANDEVKALTDEKLILGHIELSSKKSLTWY